MRFDVVVVGAGPAGSTAARECSRAGLRVALLEKAEFPRDKPCGGGVNIRTTKMLPFDLSEVTERKIYGMRIKVRAGSSYVKRSATPLTLLTQRKRLDAYLVEKAVEAGAKLFERSAVSHVERESDGVVIRSNGRAFEASAVVAADGANGPTARLAGIEIRRWTIVGLEANASSDPKSFPDSWSDVMGIDFAGVRGGYGWVFPKDDHLNFGLAGTDLGGRKLRTRLDELVRSYGFDPSSLWGLRGHPLPVRQPGSDLFAERALAIGDAAGLLDPFTGEGIFSAIWSAKAAARRLVELLAGDVHALEAYRRDIEEELEPELRLGRRMYDLFHLAPWLFAEVVRVPAVWQTGCRILQGDSTYVSMVEGSGWIGRALSHVYHGIHRISDHGSDETGRSRSGPLRYAA